MKKSSINIIFFLLLFFCTICSEGQTYFSTKGTDFWFGFMENYLVETPKTDRMKVYITADNLPATGKISVPLAGWSQNFTVKPNSTTEIIIPTLTVMCFDSEVIEKKGIHVSTDVSVSVYQLNYVEKTSDAAIIIPTPSLGTKYRVVTYSAKDGEFESSELLVVAAYDNTVIKITPTCATVGPGGIPGHPANIPYKITLNKGEVYQVKGNWTAPNDLTGTLIELDTTASDNCKKFAVFSGNKCARVPLLLCCCNTLCEQMMPIKTWGTKYITVPLKTRTTDIFRITASQNGTMVTWDGSLPIGLNAGEYYEYSSGTPTYVESNKPIAVAQFSESSKADGNDYSDPFMIMLQPLDQSLGKIVFNTFTSTIIKNYYLNVVTRTKYTGLLILDGKVVPPASFTVVPFNTDYSYARLDLLTQGNHTLQSDSGYTANIYGYGAYESFGYIAGTTFIDPEIGFNVITPTSTIKYYNFTDTICRGTKLTFAAFSNPLITDFYWKFGDGTDTVHGQKVSHTYTIAGNYTLTYYYQRNSLCGLDSITWNIHMKCCNPKPLISSNTPVCIGMNSTISDTSTYNPDALYKWDFKGGNSVSDTGQGPHQVNWTVPGKYKVWIFVTEPTCKDDSANVDITVNPIPTSGFTLNSPICAKKNTTINYTGNATPLAQFNWIFNEGTIISGTGAGPYVVGWTKSGTFDITLTVTEGGCSSTPTLVPIIVNPSPIPKFTPDPPIAYTDNPLIKFDDNSLNTSIWSWKFGEPSSGEDNFSSLESPAHTYSEEGDYTVWLVAKNSFGCIDSIYSVVYIKGYNTLFVPNAFTPNPDGINDVFQPYGMNIRDYELYIFNRWGGQIFRSETKNQPWDGKFNGKVAGMGVYVWVLLYTDQYGFKHRAMGRVTLLK